MPEDGEAWRDTLGYLDADARDRCGLPFAEARGAGAAGRHPGRAGPEAGDWHGLNAVPRLDPVDPLRLHRVLLPSAGPGTRSASAVRPIPAATRTPASTSSSTWEVRDARPVRRPDPGRSLMPAALPDAARREPRRAGAQRVGLAAAQRRHPHQPPAAGRHAPLRRRRRGRHRHRRLRRRRRDPAAAAGPGRVAGGRARRRPVLGSRHGLGQRRSAARTTCTGPSPGSSPAPTRSRSGPTTPAGGSAARWSTTPATPPASTPRLPTQTADGVGADWPIAYADLRPYYEQIEAGAPGRRGSPGPGATRTATRTARTRSAATARSSCAGPRRPASRPVSVRWPSPTAGSATGPTASTAVSACRAARSTPRPHR